jgi:hypothetical protein
MIKFNKRVTFFSIFALLLVFFASVGAMNQNVNAEAQSRLTTDSKSKTR